MSGFTNRNSENGKHFKIKTFKLPGTQRARNRSTSQRCYLPRFFGVKHVSICSGKALRRVDAIALVWQHPWSMAYSSELVLVLDTVNVCTFFFQVLFFMWSLKSRGGTHHQSRAAVGCTKKLDNISIPRRHLIKEMIQRLSPLLDWK